MGQSAGHSHMVNSQKATSIKADVDVVEIEIFLDSSHGDNCVDFIRHYSCEQIETRVKTENLLT